MTIEDRDARRQRIRQLLAAEEIRGQDELVARLRGEGFAATQSGISRDLRELGAGKLGGVYRLPGEGTDRDAAAMATLGRLVVRIQAAGPHLLVLKTAVGGASRVGLELDLADWPEIVGTVAGDDTVFVATESGAGQARLRGRIQHLLEGAPSS
ncbi:MAG: arginine repressor [Planctomycetota bacterium]